MSKQRKRISSIPGEDPVLDQASALLQEYTGKFQAIIRRIHNVREEHVAASQKRLKRLSLSTESPIEVSSQEQKIWLELVDSFRSRHDEYTRYLLGLMPQAKKLAQHVSQLITHGTNRTLSKIELSLRVAELESAIGAGTTLAASDPGFYP